MELYCCFVAYSSLALPQLWIPTLWNSREVLGDSNRKSPFCDRWRLFSFAELRDGWHCGSRPHSFSLSHFQMHRRESLELPSCPVGIVWIRSSFLHAGLLGYILHPSLPLSLPSSFPPSLPFPSGLVAKAIPPKRRLAILSVSEAVRPSWIITNIYSWFWQIGDITPLLCWLPDCSWGVSQGARTDDWCRSLFLTGQGSWRGQNPVLIRVNKGKHWGFKTNKQTKRQKK